MESALPYHTELHLDAATKQLIQQMLSSIRSVVPVTEEPEHRHEIPSEQDLQGGSQDYLMNVLVRAREVEHLLEGIADPNELRRYARYEQDYMELANQVQKILEELRKCQTAAASYARKMAELMDEHIRMVNPGVDDFPRPEDEFKLKVV